MKKEIRIKMWLNHGNAARSVSGRALSFAVPGFLPSETDCTHVQNMADLRFSFFDCCPPLREQQISVLSDSSDNSAIAGYTFVDCAVRRFRRWITVTAKTVHRVFRRINQAGRNFLTGKQILRKIALLRF